MKPKRIIPCLDVSNGRVVKGVNFVNIKDAGDPVELAERYVKEGADELVFLDISASHEERKTTYDIVEKTAQKVTIPFIVGGGIRTLEDIEKLFSLGVNKVSLGTAAVKDEKLIEKAAQKFGTEKIIVAVDAKKGQDNDWEVYINGGRVGTGIKVIDWVKKVEELGAGEILLTSMDRDGTKDGYNLELTKMVSEGIKIPVIASGGAGKLEHFSEVLSVGKADAVLAASIFHYGTFTIKEVKNFLRSQGVTIND